MGIRNALGIGPGVQVVVLITPHGDSEHDVCLVAASVGVAHNPSWGFGTGAASYWPLPSEAS